MRAWFIRVASTSIAALTSLKSAKRESRPGCHELAARGDQRAAVINRPAGFIAQQVRINVADAESPRTFEHEPFAHFELSKSEMAGAGIQNHIHAVQGQRRAGPIGDPGIFANLKADLDAAEIEMDIADRKVSCRRITEVDRARRAATA